MTDGVSFDKFIRDTNTKLVIFEFDTFEERVRNVNWKLGSVFHGNLVESRLE